MAGPGHMCASPSQSLRILLSLSLCKCSSVCVCVIVFGIGILAQWRLADTETVLLPLMPMP